MNRELVNEIVDLLVPYMGTPPQRQALVRGALYGCAVLSQIDWGEDARTFTINLVNALVNHGECEPGTPALITLLESLKSQVGFNKQEAINRLIAEITAEKPQQTPTQPVIAAFEPPKTVTQETSPPLPTSTPQPTEPKKRWWQRLGKIQIGTLIGLLLAFAALYPEQTRAEVFRALGLLPQASETPIGASTNIQTLEPSATTEPTDTFTSTFTDTPTLLAPTAAPTTMPTLEPDVALTFAAALTPTTARVQPTSLPTDTPSIAAAQSSSVNLLLSREQNIFVVYIPQNPIAGLDTIAFRYTSGSNTRTTLPLGRYPSFGLDFAALTQPACFVFRVQGDNTPLPMDCQSSGTLVFTQSLSNADVFWRDGFGQSLTLLVMQGETQIGLCGAGNASCEVNIGEAAAASG
jgi:hypothetical protein